MKLVITLDLEAIMPNGTPMASPIQVEASLQNIAAGLRDVLMRDLREREDGKLLAEHYTATPDGNVLACSEVIDEPFVPCELLEEDIVAVRNYDHGRVVS